MSAQTHTRTKSCEPLLFVPFFSLSKNFQNIANFMQSPIFRSSKPRPNTVGTTKLPTKDTAPDVFVHLRKSRNRKENWSKIIFQKHTRKKGSNILTPSRPNDQFRRTGGSSAEPRWCDAKSNQLTVQKSRVSRFGTRGVVLWRLASALGGVTFLF